MPSVMIHSCPCTQGRSHSVAEMKRKACSPECCSWWGFGSDPLPAAGVESEWRMASFPHQHSPMTEDWGTTCFPILTPSGPTCLCLDDQGKVYVLLCAAMRCGCLSPGCFSQWRVRPTLYSFILWALIKDMDQVIPLGSTPDLIFG